MKVLHVIETLGLGGAERALVNSLPALSRQGVDSEVATLWGDDALAPELEQAGYKVHRLGLSSRWNLLRGARRLGSLVRERGYDLVHCHLYFAGVYAGLARMDCARVITFHNLAYAPGCNPPGPALSLRKQLNSWVVRRRFDAAIAVSPAVASHYREHLGLGPMQVLPNGVDLSYLSAAKSPAREVLRQKYLQTGSETVLLMVGRLVPEKGHSLLLDALKGVDAPFSLLLVGDGPLREPLQHQAEQNGLGPRVQFIGSLPHDQVVELMHSADLLLAPSLHEGFGLTVAEAMAVQLPVLASTVGGLAELVNGKTAMAVEAGNVVELTVAVNRALTNPGEMTVRSEHARRKVEGEFSLQAVCRDLSSLYTDLVAA